MVHSTGANNPNLKRYACPNDGLLGENQYGNHWNQDKPDGREGCPTPWQAGRRLYRHPSGAALGLSRPALRLRLAGCADGRLHPIVQGNLCAGCSAYINQLGKQANKVE